MPPLLLDDEEVVAVAVAPVRPPAPASPASKRLRYERSSSSSSNCHLSCAIESTQCGPQPSAFPEPGQPSTRRY